MTKAIFLRLGVSLPLCLLLGGCVESDSSTSQVSTEYKQKEQNGPTTYEVQVRQKQICSLGRILVNGFPVDEWGGQAVHQTYDFPVNTVLVGEGNRLTIENEPCFSRVGDSLVIGTIQMRTDVRGRDDKRIERGRITEAEVDSAYEAWRQKARKQWERYRSRFDRGELDSLRAWASRHPMTVSTTFDNENGPDYSRIFEEAPVIRDTGRLKEYAIQLRDLMARKDTAGLVDEFLPVIWTGRDSLILSRLRSNFSEEQIRSVREHIVMDEAYLDIERADVGMRRWVGGRVWELYYKPDGNALFAARSLREGTPEYTGSGRKRPVYVAELGGDLKVVR